MASRINGNLIAIELSVEILRVSFGSPVAFENMRSDNPTRTVCLDVSRLKEEDVKAGQIFVDCLVRESGEGVKKVWKSQLVNFQEYKKEVREIWERLQAQ